MKHKQYTNLMDAIQPPDLHDELYNKVFSNHKKRSYKPLALTTVIACVLLAYICLQPNKTTTIPFLIKVQASEGPIILHSDKLSTVSLKNESINFKDMPKQGFDIMISSYEGGGNDYILNLALPITIEGENIKRITYQVDQENTELKPLYGLDNIVVGSNKEKVATIKDHLYYDEEDTRVHYKKYSEMTREGKKPLKATSNNANQH